VEFDGGLSFDETLMEVGGVNGGGTTLWDEAEGQVVGEVDVVNVVPQDGGIKPQGFGPVESDRRAELCSHGGAAKAEWHELRGASQARQARGCAGMRAGAWRAATRRCEQACPAALRGGGAGRTRGSAGKQAARRLLDGERKKDRERFREIFLHFDERVDQNISHSEPTPKFIR